MISVMLKWRIFFGTVILLTLCPPFLAAERQVSAPAASTQEAAAPQPAYVVRGNEVETRYRVYVERLETYRQKLRAALEKEAPGLVKSLAVEPQKPIQYGYQILPKLVADAPRPKEGPRATSNAYSWPRTQQFIDGELLKLAAAEENLSVVSKLSAQEKGPRYQQVVSDCRLLAENQRRIDQHVQHNRFWQKAVAEDKARFDRDTVLHDAVLARQRIVDQLQQPDFPSEERAALAAREQELSKQIQAEQGRFAPAPFLKIRHKNARLWTIQVLLYTDIGDGRFLRAAKEAIESAWHVRDEKTEFRVQVVFKRLSPRKVYGSSKPPDWGSHLDIAKHVEHFPSDGGVLTTGANSTYAMAGRYVALGPARIPHNVLAHEFGHILGFYDGYFRGYRDLGDQGYEVLEIVPNPADIMCAPGEGRAMRAHFEKLVSGFAVSVARR